MSRIEDVLQALKDPDEEAFLDAIADVNQRAVVALKDFMGTLAQARAVCKVISPDVEVSFETIEIAQTASERISRYEITEQQEIVPGVLLGFLPESRRFELRTDQTGDVVRGRIGREISEPETLRHFLAEHCTATIRVTTAERPESTSRRYTLIEIESSRWPSRPLLDRG